MSNSFVLYTAIVQHLYTSIVLADFVSSHAVRPQ